MNQLFSKLPCCQSIPKRFERQVISKVLFDGHIQQRYLERAVQRFINLNERMFSFLDIDVKLTGTDNDLSLSFQTSKYIGAIPVKMPYDGIVHKDFQVVPKFDNENEAYSELSQLLCSLDYSIKPEFSELDLLNSPMQLQPPIYYEAIKFIELFEKGYKYNWVKFDSRNRCYSFPKASTDWAKYSVASFDPKSVLVFPCRDNVLSTNHHEWKKLKYVFDIAKEQVTDSVVPSSIRLRYSERIRYISSIVSNIDSMPTDEMIIRAGDPQCIKDLKAQANVILRKTSNNCSAWRMDMALLFERYVQFVVGRAARELTGIVISNSKFYGAGNIPYWGLRYLEPDIIVRIGNNLYMGDAKYKSNFYAEKSDSDDLKETHRADLHQILAYCSFEPQTPKTGMLFYPSRKTTHKIITYTDRVGGVRNKVILCGLAFGINEMDMSVKYIKELFQSEINSI